MGGKGRVPRSASVTAGAAPVRDARHRRARRLARVRWMSLAFAAGSTCFLLGPAPGYLQLVGPQADAITFFVGSVLFTVGGALQVWLAAPNRRPLARHLLNAASIPKR